MKTPKFHVFPDKQGAWRWHLRSANGRIIAQGEAHTRKQDAERAVVGLMRTCRSLMDRYTIRTHEDGL